MMEKSKPKPNQTMSQGRCCGKDIEASDPGGCNTDPSVEQIEQRAQTEAW